MMNSANAADSAAPTHHKKSPQKGKWFWLKRTLTIAFFVIVLVLLVILIRNIDWAEVIHALRDYKLNTLLMAAGIALASYLVFASYDLIGKKYTHHSLPARQVLPLAFVCYAFTLNLTAWVGGIALRFRLYSRLGLEPATITKILSMSLITNWLGYIILAGVLFSFRMVALPSNFHIGATALQAIGILLLLIAAMYFLACRFSKRRSFHLRDHEIRLPNVTLACAQASLAIVNWMLMGLLIYTLMPDGVNYQTILGILLISSIAGVVAHIPAGLGVLETIFVTMLHHQLSKGSILAALIGYRILYFLVPLGIACIIYFVLEARAKNMQEGNQQTNETAAHTES